MISMPEKLADFSKDLFSKHRSLDDELGRHVPTSLEEMEPGSRFVRLLNSMSIHPDVKVHSIVAVDGDGPVEEGNDGVVEYKSAHLREADTEIVVRSPHSCQSHPETVQELRRILTEHLREFDAQPAED